MTLPPTVSDLTTRFLEEVDERLPGRLTGLFLHGSLCWGEFFPDSDVDFVAVWDELPSAGELGLLRAAHQATKDRRPTLAFDGFHCTAADLAASPAKIVHRRSVFFRGELEPAGTLDINPVTWHELAERGIPVRGEMPVVHTNLTELLDYTRDNLDTFWRDIAKQIEGGDVEAFGAHDASVAFVGLGPARLHHLLVTNVLTSKSGAGRYVLESLHPRWHLIARESLRLRENNSTTSLYESYPQRGQDAYDLLRWLVDDGVAQAGVARG